MKFMQVRLEKTGSSLGNKIGMQLTFASSDMFEVLIVVPLESQQSGAVPLTMKQIKSFNLK
jgi:hypothetical protein